MVTLPGVVVGVVVVVAPGRGTAVRREWLPRRSHVGRHRGAAAAWTAQVGYTAADDVARGRSSEVATQGVRGQGLSVRVVLWLVHVVRGGPQMGRGRRRPPVVVVGHVRGGGKGRRMLGRGRGGGGVVTAGVATTAAVGLRGVHLCHFRHAGERGDGRHGASDPP